MEIADNLETIIRNGVDPAFRAFESNARLLYGNSRYIHTAKGSYPDRDLFESAFEDWFSVFKMTQAAEFIDFVSEWDEFHEEPELTLTAVPRIYPTRSGMRALTSHVANRVNRNRGNIVNEIFEKPFRTDRNHSWWQTRFESKDVPPYFMLVPNIQMPIIFPSWGDYLPGESDDEERIVKLSITAGDAALHDIYDWAPGRVQVPNMIGALTYVATLLEKGEKFDTGDENIKQSQIVWRDKRRQLPYGGRQIEAPVLRVNAEGKLDFEWLEVNENEWERDIDRSRVALF